MCVCALSGRVWASALRQRQGGSDRTTPRDRHDMDHEKWPRHVRMWGGPPWVSPETTVGRAELRGVGCAGTCCQARTAGGGFPRSEGRGGEQHRLAGRRPGFAPRKGGSLRKWEHLLEA